MYSIWELPHDRNMFIQGFLIAFFLAPIPVLDHGQSYNKEAKCLHILLDKTLKGSRRCMLRNVSGLSGLHVSA